MPPSSTSNSLRGTAGERLPHNANVGLPYQQARRSIGRFLGQEGLRDFRFIEQPDGVLLQASGGVLRRGFRTYRLNRDRLEELLMAMRSGTPAILSELAL